MLEKLRCWFFGHQFEKNLDVLPNHEYIIRIRCENCGKRKE